MGTNVCSGAGVQTQTDDCTQQAFDRQEHARIGQVQPLSNPPMTFTWRTDWLYENIKAALKCVWRSSRMWDSVSHFMRQNMRRRLNAYGIIKALVLYLYRWSPMCKCFFLVCATVFAQYAWLHTCHRDKLWMHRLSFPLWLHHPYLWHRYCTYTQGDGFAAAACPTHSHP